MRIKKQIPDWVIGLAVTLFFLFISFTGMLDFTDPVEMRTFDFRARLAAPPEKNPDIELVVISDEDVRELGRFPWPRHILAQGIRNLTLAGARVVALNILFTEPEESAGLKAVHKLKESYERLALAQDGPGLSFYRELSQTIIELDNDAKLYSAFKDAGNIVLPIYFDTRGAGVDKEAPEFILRNAFKRVRGTEDNWAVSSMVWVSKVQPILPSMAEVAAGIGHSNLFHDPDGYVRNQIHALGYLEEFYFPSFPMAIVRVFKGLKDENITLVPGQGIELKENPSTTLHVPVIDPRMRTLIRWNKGPGVTFSQTPFAKVYKNEFQTSLFRDKIVILGLTAEGTESRLVTPISGNLPGIEVVANSVANILNQRFFSRPGWVLMLELAMLLLFGFYVSIVLPRMKAGMGAFTTLTLFVLFGVFGTVLFFSYGIWLKITAPMMLLILGYILIVSKRFLITEKTKERVEADSVETNKMLGLSFQQQGMLDLAFEKFRKLPIGEEGVKDLLYNLGLDFERKRQFSKALATYMAVIEDGVTFKDLADRIPKLKGAEATMIFGGGGSAHPGDIGATLKDMDTSPTLGRYEVIGELGRGAMGVVYKGQDPKIHRTVAIKTLSLSNFDDDVLDDLKERFFREAESAGLLTHPNIVTIFDCGEEHDLAFIAMEYLEGEDLEEYTQKGRLMPIREALSTVADVAGALDYAHGKGIVHRDIKPANIMRIKESSEVKVTDFGIARITSSSKTRTGLVLGTPSYMSPEQIAGKKVDGRSDIFSLGIVLYEMLTGQKPFFGEDMTSLMYRIAREKHPAPREINPKIPQVVEKIIDKALEKDPGKRYQKAGQLADHLRIVIARIDEISARKRQENQT